MRTTLLLLFTFYALSGQAQSRSEHEGHDHGKTATVQPAGDDPLVLSEMKYDFGKIPQGKPVYHVFSLKNTGKTPLKLDNVQAACGCTTPEWNREEIAPGATAQIRVGYNAAAEGAFEKPVTLYYGERTKQFTVAGSVWRTPEGPAPRNASIDLLKKQTP